MRRLRAVRGDPMTARDVTAPPTGSEASGAKSLTIRPRVEKRAETTRRAAVRLREMMALRDATILPRGSATNGARRIITKTGPDRNPEPATPRPTTARARRTHL